MRSDRGLGQLNDLAVKIPGSYRIVVYIGLTSELTRKE